MPMYRFRLSAMYRKHEQTARRNAILPALKRRNPILKISITRKLAIHVTLFVLWIFPRMVKQVLKYLEITVVSMTLIV